MEIQLSNQLINDNLSFDSFISHYTLFREVYYASGLEHYRLLSYLSTFFNNELLLDVGARYGYSAIALAYNQNNRVISYDIKNELALTNVECLLNISFSYEDDITILPETLASKIIMLDVDPHDGVYEIKILKFLKENQWKGLLIFDDTRQDLWPSIYDVVNNEKDIEKIDVTKYGHFSGTTILNFSDDIKFILE